MGDDEFWEIIEECNAASTGDMNRKDQLVEAAIGRLSRDHALEFYRIFHRMMDSAFAWPLWGAAYVINGGCGDDTFSDFRASLISRGRAPFEKAIVDPDSLADEDIDLDSWFHEGFAHAISDGFTAKLGKRPVRVDPHPASPAGVRWPEATVHEIYPKLMRKLGSN
jgi:hypothetical protein